MSLGTSFLSSASLTQSLTIDKFEEIGIKQGYEEGKQKFWNEEGRVINNFTVKNGKLYGVIGRYDCMSVKAMQFFCGVVCFDFL